MSHIGSFQKKKEIYEKSKEFSDSMKTSQYHKFSCNGVSFRLDATDGNVKTIHPNQELNIYVQYIIEEQSEKIIRLALDKMRNDLLNVAVKAKDEVKKIKTDIENFQGDW